MSEAQNEPKPVVDPEAEGLPSTADDDSSAYDDTASARVADGPDPAALPADHPTASLDYGTTPAEAGTSEPLADRLDREIPEPDPYAEAADPDDPTDPANTSDQPDPGDATIEPDTFGTGTAASPDAVADGPDPDGSLIGAPSDGLVDVTGADLTDSDELHDPETTIADPTELLAPDDHPSDTGVLDNETSAQDEDQPGRLVTPDEGAHPDRERTEIATDAGPAGGGLTAEEAAIHPER